MRATQHNEPNLESCGFVCASCNFRLLLSDLEVSKRVVEVFKLGITSVDIACPECGSERCYTREDLKFFLPDGKQSSGGKAKSTANQG